jgi:arabinosyltransferase B
VNVHVVLLEEAVLDAEPAQIDLGTATRSGLWSPGRIRIKA